MGVGNTWAQGRYFHPSIPKKEDYVLNQAIQIGESLSKEILRGPHVEQIMFEILDKNQKVVRNGRGSSLAQYTFDKPGDYTINIELDPSVYREQLSKCTHSDMPSKILLKVVPFRLVYHIEDMKISSQLKGGNQEGSYITIPVDFYTSGETPFSLSKLFVKSVGIEANLIGAPSTSENLSKTGKYDIRFNLKGTLLSGSYIMLNFIDAAENDITISYQSIVL